MHTSASSTKILKTAEKHELSVEKLATLVHNGKNSP
jgi:hypothetical protein